MVGTEWSSWSTQVFSVHFKTVCEEQMRKVLQGQTYSGFIQYVTVAERKEEFIGILKKYYILLSVTITYYVKWQTTKAQ